jgi:O-antigen/teichoic acid export membrane protein
MNHIFSKYIMAGGVTLCAKILAAFGALAEIYFLNMLLGKEGYGAFIYAFTLIMIVGITIGNPIRSLVLYRLSSEKKDILSFPFFKSAFGLSIILGLFSIAIITFFGWNYWIVGLTAIAAFEMTRVTLCSGLQAMQKIPTMTFYNTLLPYGFRLIALGLLAVFAVSNSSMIVIGYTIAFALPVIILAIRYKIIPSLSLKPFIRSDFFYGLKMVLTQLVHQNSRYIDIIFIGSIGLMTATADYVVALKFATLLLLGKQLTQGLITPRLTDDEGHKEFAAARFFEMMIAMSGMIGFATIGWFILPFFGDYASVETLFFLCAISMIPRVMTGSSAEFLSMKGHAGWIFIASLITLITTICAAFILIPQYGSTGSALTAIIGAFIANLILGIGAYYEEKFKVTDIKNGIIAIVLTITCFAIGFQFIAVSMGGIILFLIFMAYLFLHRHYIQFIKEYISNAKR